MPSAKNVTELNAASWRVGWDMLRRLIVTLLAADQLMRLPLDQKIRLQNQLQPGSFVKQVAVTWTLNGVATTKTHWVWSGYDVR